MRTMAKTIVIALCMLGAASSAVAAPLRHRPAPPHWNRHTPARIGAYGHAYGAYAAPHALGFQPFSAAEERWFRQAKGNIW
jgi:hypothetical protein